MDMDAKIEAELLSGIGLKYLSIFTGTQIENLKIRVDPNLATPEPVSNENFLRMMGDQKQRGPI